ncbi:MAG TPA: hypothetical protein VG796_29945 [Verrucomicrobiales bacterium]|jgi:hypothetical protein|nr:hypothetical protein [Verrucomicrobiales bacterium]
MNESIDRRIAELERELAGLRRQKLSELQHQMAALQASIDSVGGGAPAARGPGRRPGRPPKAAKGWAGASSDTGSFDAAPRKRRGRKRGKHIPDNDALGMLSRVVSSAGKEGISARKASQLSGIFYPRAIKLMDDHFKKSGSGKWTRYSA